MDLLHAAACYVEDLPDTTPASKSARPWAEWVDAARLLRSKNTRLDIRKQPAPMTWLAVAEWILENDRRAAGLKAASIVAELSSLCSPSKKNEDTTV
jgi:hypothetical protein